MKPNYILLICCALLGAAILVLVVFTSLPVQAMPLADTPAPANAVQNEWGKWEALEMQIQPSSSPTATITYIQHLPVIFGFGLPAYELDDFWTGNAEGMPMLAFQAGDEIQNVVKGINNYYVSLEANLEISVTSGSETSQVIGEMINMPIGSWEDVSGSTAPANLGMHTQRVKLTYKTLSPTLETQYAINPTSQIVINQQQGFDRCYAPTLEEMQTWWEKSPYFVFNLYIGGVSFACRDEPVDALWVHQAADQGWEFILTWVGPQAPCTSFKYRMSSNPSVAYVEGKLEAEYAAEAARELGFFGDAVIYYDIEGYTNDAECRDTVESFLQGWVEQLQANNLRAGAYGSPCRSYITDWATIPNPPDDIWIAHWITDEYDPSATVWDVPCGLGNTYWNDHQRLKQYAGGHEESWGGVELVIDSNVLDGHITALPLQTNNTVYNPQIFTTTLTQSGPQIDDFGLINQGHGWVLTGGRLLVTTDSGQSWEQHSPANIQVSAVGYPPTGEGWLVGRDTELGQLQVGHTNIGSRDWSFASFPREDYDLEHSIARSYIEVLDSSTAYLVFRLASSSNFSIGRMFFTQDSGRSWQERSIPIGEEVHFRNANEGWTTGGVTRMEHYQTEDGGGSWIRYSPSEATDQDEFIPLPQLGNLIGIEIDTLPAKIVDMAYYDLSEIWVLAIDTVCEGVKGLEPLSCQLKRQLFTSAGNNVHWQEITPNP